MDAKEIKENPKEFYDQVVTLIWLMGNLTPTVWGTGRYVEQWLALAHHFHGLPVPVLKLGFQLDCINLTMDLDRYKKLFLHFMEPNSLMPSAQLQVLHSVNDPDVNHFLPLINKMDSHPSLATHTLRKANDLKPMFFEKPKIKKKRKLHGNIEFKNPQGLGVIFIEIAALYKKV